MLIFPTFCQSFWFLDNDFDIIAPFYDQLKNWVFRGKLSEAERAMLSKVSAADTVLIAGGGTGEFIPIVTTICTGEIHFVEKSDKMISRARNREGADKVKFYACDIQNFDLQYYDLIITSFILDIFEPDDLQVQIDRLSSSLKPGGKWIYTDFQRSETIRQKILLWLMIRFFRFTTGLNAKKLYDHLSMIKQKGLELKHHEESVNGFVAGAVFQKTTSPGS